MGCQRVRTLYALRHKGSNSPLTEGCRYHLLSIGLDNLENLHEVNFTAPPFSPSPAFQDKLWFAHALEETINSRGIEAPAEDPVHNLVLRKGTIIYKCEGFITDEEGSPLTLYRPKLPTLCS